MDRMTVAVRALLTMGLLLLTAVGCAYAPPAQAAPSSVPADATLTPRPEAATASPSEQYVFSMGMVDQVSASSLTVNFGDGATETYTLNDATTVQTQNGDALRPVDLEVGEMVIVLTVEDESLARTIVSGGQSGFHEAGPGDIRGHDEQECVDCDAHAP